ncbi:ELMO/CED-12 family-domain-containing protein [Pisolithus orientalis]|uniref:ELMO/CED-12 family-domain-containing protein n=1 Tax=Pisolithus orientalis TaxID=936130 RepID=UPI00222478A8|nr:ELMO/CED-12 family-domain-containing protein [Pisolithus orientalis]KAI5999373.1 ELMO/CED-12 family-domain-containing protein [Pisolithus orientalis]
MSSANNSTRATPSPLTSNGVQPKSTTGIIPTNNVTTKAGVTVRARIDPTLTVEDVVRQLCLHLKVTEPHTALALRDRDTEELITSENLRKKIKNKVHLKLVNSSAIEAAGIVAKLSLREEKSLRMSLFSLQRFIKEEKFAQEFLDRDGLRELVDVIETAHGNTLAYALTAMQNLMDLDYGWSTLDDSFIFKVVQILSSPNSLINVCRPATAILKKLVEADPTSVPGPIIASSSRIPPVAPAGSVYRYGFQSVYEQMRRQKGSLETVVSRLGSPDTAMAQHSVMLINSLLSHVNDTYWDEFIADLERLNVRKAIIRLMSSHVDDLTSCVLDFQANIVRVTYRKKTTLVEPEVELAHLSALHYIWECSGVQEGLDSEGHPSKWRRLGFDSENIVEEFQDAGVLGLDCLVNFVQDDPDFFSKVILEQLSRPEERRCPVAKASNEVVELLSQHWTIFAPAYSTSAFQPLFLNFQKVHCLALHFFLRMWNESGSAVDDFNRIADLTRSQIKVALQQESAKPWHEVEHDFLEREYRAVRDRQMQELEAGDDLLSRVPVRNLKEKLTRESAEFVRQQRIHCLLQGAWFLNGVPTQHTGSARRPNGQWRFMRLDNGLKYLHYVDSSAKIDVRNGTEDLPERIEIASINQITTGTCAPLPNLARDHPDIPTTLSPSPLSFSLLSAGGESLADQIATHQSRWADWTDGLNMLRRDSGHVTSEETAGYIKALTEIGLKIKLLDLSGEKVDIPSGLVAGPPPTNTDFFFSDLL